MANFVLAVLVSCTCLSYNCLYKYTLFTYRKMSSACAAIPDCIPSISHQRSLTWTSTSTQQIGACLKLLVLGVIPILISTLFGGTS